VNEAKRLRALEKENRRLKQLVAEQALDSATPRQLAPPSCQPSASGCELYRAVMVEAARRGRNAMAV